MIAKRVAERLAQLPDRQELERELVSLEQQIKDREGHYYSAQEAIADGPLVQKLTQKLHDTEEQLRKMGWQRPIQNLSELKQEVLAFVDEQTGLENVAIDVAPNGSIYIQAPRWSIEEETVTMGEELVELLERLGYGKYHITNTSKGLAAERN